MIEHRIVRCPICKQRWAHVPGETLRSTDGNDRIYHPMATHIGYCTCGPCHFEPTPVHIEPNCGGLSSGIGDQDPMFDNVVRAMEEC